MFLAADVGGTKADFALFQNQNNELVPVKEKQYSSKNTGSLEEILRSFLENVLEPSEVSSLKSACFSLAGPVRNGSCYLVNLGWSVELEQLKKAFPSIPQIKLCNDLEAVGYGLSLLSGKDLLCLTPNLSSQTESPSTLFNRAQNKAILAPGTGLGECLLMGDMVCPSEGAHCEFGPRTDEEARLWYFFHHKYGHVSYDRILSGPGIKNIYEFLSPHPVPPDLTPEQISSQALNRLCPVCCHTLDLFLSILGAEAGNLALKSLALGGIYLGGGILPKILPLLQGETFLQSFRSKGRSSYLMEQIPIYAILNSRTALYGAALLASRV